MYLDFNFQSEDIVLFRETPDDLFLAHQFLKIDQILFSEYSINTLWLCDNESAYDLWDILIKDPIFRLKHEKYCLFWKNSEMVYV